MDALLFVNRIKIWVRFYGKNKTLPNSFSKNTTFYIASNIVNIEYIIEFYIKDISDAISFLDIERNDLKLDELKFIIYVNNMDKN